MTSTARSKSDTRKKTPSGADILGAAQQAASVSQSDIARRAFELYCARGGQHGSDVDDWLRAERELLGPAAPPRKRSPRRTTALD